MKNKVYISIGLLRNNPPEIIGVYFKKQDAEKAAYSAENITKYTFTNVIEKTIK